jgi:hypothetical protein
MGPPFRDHRGDHGRWERLGHTEIYGRLWTGWGLWTSGRRESPAAASSADDPRRVPAGQADRARVRPTQAAEAAEPDVEEVLAVEPPESDELDDPDPDPDVDPEPDPSLEEVEELAAPDVAAASFWRSLAVEDLPPERLSFL